MKWEYKVINNRKFSEDTSAHIDPFYSDLGIDELNQLGDDGWELVSYSCFSGGNPAAIFKRPKN